MHLTPCCALTRISLRLASTFATGLSWAESATADDPTAFPLPPDRSCCLPQERSRKTDLDFAGCFTFQKKKSCLPAHGSGRKTWRAMGRRLGMLLFGDSAVLDQSSWSQLQNSPAEMYVKFGWASSTSLTWQEETALFACVARWISTGAEECQSQHKPCTQVESGWWVAGVKSRIFPFCQQQAVILATV